AVAHGAGAGVVQVDGLREPPVVLEAHRPHHSVPVVGDVEPAAVGGGADVARVGSPAGEGLPGQSVGRIPEPADAHRSAGAGIDGGGGDAEDPAVADLGDPV